MTKEYAERYDEMLEEAYGPFTPGSLARAIRWDNWQNGNKTCWNCLCAFRSRRVAGTDGKLHRFGRGRWFCSTDCALADRRRRARERPIVELGEDGTLTLDLRGCWECAA